MEKASGACVEKTKGKFVVSKYPWGDNITHDNANYSGVGERDKWYGMSPVGTFEPNRYGLYDMSGNVFEWCSDWYDERYYSQTPRKITSVHNPKGPKSGDRLVLRGGAWNSNPDDLEFLIVIIGYHQNFQTIQWVSDVPLMLSLNYMLLMVRNSF